MVVDELVWDSWLGIMTDWTVVQLADIFRWDSQVGTSSSTSLHICTSATSDFSAFIGTSTPWWQDKQYMGMDAEINKYGSIKLHGCIL